MVQVLVSCASGSGNTEKLAQSVARVTRELSAT
jgi:flavodoxin